MLLPMTIVSGLAWLPVMLAAVVAAPVLRLESHYFALATLGIGQVLLLLAIGWQDLTGGANGLSGIPGLALLGYEVRKGVGIMVAVWCFVAIGALLSLRITRGLYGAALQISRENPVAAQAASSGRHRSKARRARRISTGHLREGLLSGC